MIERAIIYLPDTDSRRWALSRAGGGTILFRVLKAAERAGIRVIGIPGALREKAGESKLGSVNAELLWLDRLSPGEKAAFTSAPALLLPASVLLSQARVKGLIEAGEGGDGAALDELKGSPTPVLAAPPDLVAGLWERLEKGSPLGEELEARLRSSRPLLISGEGLAVPVTDARSLKAAVNALYQSLGIEADSLVDRYINRRGSRFLTRCLIRLPVTPNQVTLLSLAIGGTGIWALWNATVTSALAGLALYMLSVVADHSDGEIARLTFQESSFGERLDFTADCLTHAGTALAMGVTASSVGGPLMAFAGGAAAFGIIVSALFTRFRSKSRRPDEPLGSALSNVGNRDPFYLVMAAFILSLWQAPGLLPYLVGTLAVGTQIYWLMCLAHLLRRSR